MKFKLLILLTIISISLCFKTKATNNKFYRYCKGLLGKLGIPDTHIDECIDPEWRTDTSQDYIDQETQFNNANDSFAKLDPSLTQQIDTQCNNKKQLIAYFMETCKNEKNKPKPASYRFLQAPNKKKKPAKAAPAGGKPPRQFPPFDVLYKDIEKFKISFNGVSNTPFMAKTKKFLKCYGDAKGTPATGNNNYIYINT